MVVVALYTVRSSGNINKLYKGGGRNPGSALDHNHTDVES